MKFIGYGNVSLHLLYPFFCPVASMIRIIAFSLFGEFYSDFLFVFFVFFLSDIACVSLMFLTYFISKKESKRERTNSENEEKKEVLIDSNENVDKNQEVLPKNGQIVIYKFDFIPAKKKQIKPAKLLFYNFINAFLDFISFNLSSIQTSKIINSPYFYQLCY